MASSEDDVASRLAAIVERAAPTDAASAHVASRELERVRSGDEGAELEASYRHLASCASCRARLAAQVASDVTATGQEASAPPRVVARGRRPSRLAWAALAAAVLIALGFVLVPRERMPDRLVIVQRPYSGIMGSQQAESPGTHTNLELSFFANAHVTAFLVPCGEGGELLSAPIWFMTEGGDRATVTVAPRAFAQGSGKVVAFVVWGKGAAVHAVALRVNSLAPPVSRALTERRITELAQEHGARVQRVELLIP